MSKHEKITAAQLNKHAAPHCSNCGSSDLMCTGRNRWDAESANWYTVEVNEDECVCCNCGRDVMIKWKLS